ncbi:MAG TPA: response regulator [Phycisphaerae bacterium]|jgi:DNA-binding response OmpR family regulator|nr:response regulator [Phycisphaerae bacterium]HOB74612.1 response regulator [Phycisphaerae bacterium]HOJ53567.1 response regulator [Phycisphaerae bacterium]HOL25276.1 response regulator [Phycisphaerae bacterium]HPP20509.1 response regulator [Phycisphaerae bacterium]
MVADPTLLVVDDEEIICQGCRRVLSRQGFRVETANEAHAGLALASERDYDAILLDITMPRMDGIEFLEKLRQRKPDVPVIVITGHPTIANAASAVRLQASDYITKPFTPEMIIQSVRRLVGQKKSAPAETPARQPQSQAASPRGEGLRFWDEAWLQPVDGEVRLGALLGRSVGVTVQSVRLPRIGEVVYQGLPMAGLIMTDGLMGTVPAPISGVVTAVNNALLDHPGALMDTSQCGSWIVTVAPARFDEEQTRCRYRRVLLLNRDEPSAERQAKLLTDLGCQVVIGREWDERLLTSQDPSATVVVINSQSFGDSGPELVEKIAAIDPATKVIVVAAEKSQWENAYRRRGIFYYALNPFADGEIVEILDGAFRQARGKLAQTEVSRAPAEFMSKICITNRNHTRVCLLVEGGLMQKDHGLGQQVARALFDRLFPVEVTLGSSNITPVKVLKAASAYQQVFVLLARDSGRLPGTFVEHKGDYIYISGPDAERVTTLVVQPDPVRPGPLKFDERTTAALADQIVGYMARA